MINPAVPFGNQLCHFKSPPSKRQSPPAGITLGWGRLFCRSGCPLWGRGSGSSRHPFLTGAAHSVEVVRGGHGLDLSHVPGVVHLVPPELVDKEDAMRACIRMSIHTCIRRVVRGVTCAYAVHTSRPTYAFEGMTRTAFVQVRRHMGRSGVRPNGVQIPPRAPREKQVRPGLRTQKYAGRA